MGLAEGGTRLLLKKLSPTRLAEGEFMRKVTEMEERGATKEELSEFLGKGRAKRGIFEGDLQEGEIEIGQICSMIKEPETVAEIFASLV